MRRRFSAAVFVLLCAPCFVGFLVFVGPPVAAAIVGSAVLQSVFWGVALGAAVLGYHLWARRRLRRHVEEVAPKRLDAAVSER